MTSMRTRFFPLMAAAPAKARPAAQLQIIRADETGPCGRHCHGIPGSRVETQSNRPTIAETPVWAVAPKAVAQQQAPDGLGQVNNEAMLVIRRGLDGMQMTRSLGYR